MKKIIGIDLGTTNSVVAIMEAGDATVIVNEEGARTTPSVVAYADKEVLVGTPARRQAVVNPKKTISSAKRFIGAKYDEVKEAIAKSPFDVVEGKSGGANFRVGDKTYTPQEISAKVLQKLKRAAENFTGEEITEAVITVPAYFNDDQRQATKDAGKIAGLDVKRIINEPTAAALAYGLDKKEDEVIAVYDFGGGTFDVSILEVSEKMVEVLATAGDTRLGGDNIDEVLIDYLISEFKKDSGIDVSKDAMVLQRLREAAEKAKIELSTTMQTNVNLPFLTADAAGPKHMSLDISRAKFEQLVGTLVEKTFAACKKAVKDSKKTISEIDQVILVGGSTRMPLVQEKVKSFFKKEPHRGVNPDEVVALGAAIQGGVLAGSVSDVLLLDVTPLSLGIETLGGVFTKLIDRNTTVPTRKVEIFSTAENNQGSVDIHILQGEREIASANRTLGKFVLNGIPPAPRGIPQVEVSFDLDANGILKVSAADKATGKDHSITITNSSGLSDVEISAMIQEAKENEHEDKAHKEKIELKNKLDVLVYQAETDMQDHGNADLADTVATAKRAVENEDITQMNSAYQNLTTVLHKIAEEKYANPSGGNGSHEESSTFEDDVVDAEIVEESPPCSP
jgi:molecular chaperone DnaK